MKLSDIRNGLKNKLIECVSLGKGLFSILRICKFGTSAKTVAMQTNQVDRNGRNS
jgi:hypothetical protein